MDKEIKLIGVEECIKNAKELLESSKILFEKEKYNHAYFFATLAFEEIGKSQLILISQLPTKKPSDWAKKNFDDHIKKIFWAFFGPMFGKDVITNDLLKETEGIAKRIHETRLRGLYVDIKENELEIPQNLNLKEETENLISLVEARLNIEIYEKQLINYNEEPEELVWFIKATEDDEKRKGILGRESMKKLAEFGNVKDWIKWLKDIYDKSEEENKEILKKELLKSITKKGSFRPKWKVRFRVYSDSHSIKQKELNTWNNMVDWLKMYAVDGRIHKNEIIVEIIGPDTLHIKQLFNYSWHMQRMFLLAINMGSIGFIWWNIPKYRNKFYETAFDIENKAPFVMEIAPVLKIEWNRGVLSGKELKNAAICFSQITKIKVNEKANPLNYYFGGLLFLGLNDLNYRCENQSFINFYLCFKYQLKYFKIWDGESDYRKIFTETLRGFNIEQKHIDEFIQLGEGLLNKNSKDEITLENVGSIKVLCDVMFIKKFSYNISNNIKND